MIKLFDLAYAAIAWMASVTLIAILTGGCDSTEPPTRPMVGYSPAITAEVYGDDAAQGRAAESLDELTVADAFGVHPDSFTSEHSADIDRDVSGYSRGRGLAIVWGQQFTHPLDVIDATLGRLRHVQTTASANDANSRAIWRLEQARDELTGQAINSPGRSVLGSQADGEGE